jgi:type II secretory ATPase GspE/PulE/Tfp pilus assembly ATPase PilB-like protein
MSGFDSISSLTSAKKKPSDDTPQAKLAAKQKEIQLKKVEAQTEARANLLGLDYVNLFGFPISPEALSLIDEAEAKASGLVCFFYDGDNIRLGTTNTDNPRVKEISDQIIAKYYTKNRIYLISQNSLDHALDLYKTLPKIKKYETGVEIKEEDLARFAKEIANYRALQDQINKVSVTDIVTLILATALKVEASDVHIEAEEKGVIIRLRLDGMLQEAATLDSEKWKKIVARMKILAGVKINVEDRPQDGRYSIFLKNEKIEVRSSFLPTAYGESVVMRILRSGSVSVSFESLGLRPEALKIIQEQIARPNGLILSAGPTGSGKTTTLYAILNKLNRPGAKIITLEDPIEYQLPGISQSQVDPAAGYTFANGLRSILRQDPDIVMVGEIRDLETAEIAVQSSLTGHFVLSTLHTNDAAGVIPRMLDMGVKPYFLVPSINAVIGQRLVRKLCPQCRVEHELTPEEREQAGKILGVISPKANVDIPTVLPMVYSAGPGCPACNGIGYKGRIGIFEIFTPDDKIKQLTIDNAPSFKILQQAIENGMLTMLQDGVLKTFAGVTSLEEVYRVVGDFSYVNELYDIVVSQTIGRGVKIKAEEIARAKKLLLNISSIAEELKNVPTNEVINIILALAVQSEAGDLHIEPSDHDVKVRFRIDGVMHDIVALSREHYLPVLGEIKILSGFATGVKHPTMDGRFAIYLDASKMDCRVSIISGGYGETIVVRFLSGQAEASDMEKLGIEDYAKESLEQAVKKTKGIIITTGPTGSGKTTTLYSLLKKLNTPDVKIITVEDPIEYQMEGVIQTQVDVEKGYTFAAAMRSLLRQNPNIMMIGEIRDNETAKIAIEASQTGHLVLSTIHANSAAGAISRFIGLGIDRQMLANSIETSVGQRLVRKICPYCKQEDHLSPEVLAQVQKVLGSIKNPKVIIPKDWKFHKGTGCEKCNFIGYKGRLGLYEILSVTPTIQKAIQNPNMTDYDIEQAAIAEGLITVMQDGFLKVLKGETSVEEVLRVTQ